MNSNNKKYNKLAIVSFVLLLLGLAFSVIKYLASAGTLLFLASFIISIFAYFEIKKTGEKGKGLAVTPIVLCAFIILSMVLLYLPIWK